MPRKKKTPAEDDDDHHSEVHEDAENHQDPDSPHKDEARDKNLQEEEPHEESESEEVKPVLRRSERKAKPIMDLSVILIESGSDEESSSSDLDDEEEVKKEGEEEKNPQKKSKSGAPKRRKGPAKVKKESDDEGGSESSDNNDEAGNEDEAEGGKPKPKKRKRQPTSGGRKAKGPAKARVPKNIAATLERKKERSKIASLDESELKEVLPYLVTLPPPRIDRVQRFNSRKLGSAVSMALTDCTLVNVSEPQSAPPNSTTFGLYSAFSQSTLALDEDRQIRKFGIQLQGAFSNMEPLEIFIGVTVRDPSVFHFSLPTAEVGYFLQVWFIKSFGEPVFDAEKEHYQFVCPDLATISPTDLVEVVVDRIGHLSLLINNRPCQLTSPTPPPAAVVPPAEPAESAPPVKRTSSSSKVSIRKTKSGKAPMFAAEAPPCACPINSELYGIILFPKSFAGQARVSGEAGVGISLEEQRIRAACRQKIAEAHACSAYEANKVVFEAVRSKNFHLLQACHEATDKISSIHSTWGPDITTTPLSVAIEMNDLQTIEFFHSHYDSGRTPLPSNTIAADNDTGSVGSNTYTHAVGKVGVARGGRLGNTAFIDWGTGGNFTGLTMGNDRVISVAWHRNLQEPVLNFLISQHSHDFNWKDEIVYAACEQGNVTVALPLLKNIVETSSGWGFTQTFLTALTFTKSTVPTPKYQSRSLLKKPNNGMQYTPLHLAAANPDSAAYFLFNTVTRPHEAIPDSQGRLPIHFAAGNPNPQILTSLIKQGISPLTLDKNGVSPLALAAKHGRVENVRILLEAIKRQAQNTEAENEEASGQVNEEAVPEAEAPNPEVVEEEEPEPDQPVRKGGKKEKILPTKYGKVNASGLSVTLDRNGFHAIHYAAHFAHIEVIEALVAAGLPIDLPDKQRRNALTIAAVSGHLDCMMALIKLGARVDYRDKRGCSALHHAAKNGQFAACQLLCREGISFDGDSSGNVPLHLAAAYGWLKVAQLLEHYGADLNENNLWKTSALSIAVIKGHAHVVHWLLSRPTVQVNDPDSKGLTLMHHACSILHFGTIQLVRDLLERGADPNFADMNGKTPLHYVCSSSNPESANLVHDMLEHGADPNIVDSSCLSSLHVACSAIYDHSFDMIKDLLEHRANPNLEDPTGRTVAHIICNASGNESSIVRIVTHLFSVCNFNVADQNGNTPLSEVLTKGLPTLISFLLKQGLASQQPVGGKEMQENMLHKLLNLAKSQVITEFWDAIMSSTEKPVMKDMLSFRSKISGCTPLLSLLSGASLVAPSPKSTTSNSETLLLALLESAVSTGIDINDTIAENAPSNPSCTALHLACGNTANLPIVEFLCKHGANVNALDPNGQPPLFYAIRTGNMKMVKLLLSHHADTKFLSKSSLSSCLHIVLIEMTRQASTLLPPLLNAGADVNARDSSGKTALSIVLQKTMLPELDLLLSHHCNPNIPDNNGLYPMAQAVMYSRKNPNSSLVIERKLMKAGALVDCTDSEGRTLMHFGFIDAGVQPNRTEHTGATADNIEIVSDLCSLMGVPIDTSDKYGRSPLHYASQTGALICSQYLISRGADVNRPDGDGNTPLALALLAHQVNYAVSLIRSKACISDLVHLGGHHSPMSIFNYAVSRKFMGLTFLLIDEGIDIHTCIHGSLGVGKFQLVRTLIGKTRADIIQSSDKHGQNLMHILAGTAIKAENDSFIREYAFILADELASKGVATTTLDNHKNTPLHLACKSGNYCLIDYFVSQGCNINARNSSGMTPLQCALNHFSGSSSFTTVVQTTVLKLLKHNPDCTRSNGDTPFIISAVRSLVAMAPKELYRAPKPVVPAPAPVSNYKPFSGFRAAPAAPAFIQQVHIAGQIHGMDTRPDAPAQVIAIEDKPPEVESLFHEGEITVHAAYKDVGTSMYRLISWLLAHGAPINATDADGMTVVHHCVNNHHLRVLDFLTRASQIAHSKTKSRVSVLNVNVADKQGFSPIHYLFDRTEKAFATSEHVGLLKLLVSSGADVNLPAKNGRTPLYYATRQKADSMREYLIQSGARQDQNDIPAVIQEEVEEVKAQVDFAAINQAVQSKLEKALAQVVERAAQKAANRPVSVDKVSGLQDTSEVVCIDETVLPKQYYSVLLTQTDVSYGSHGKNDFYRMQLLWNRAQKLHILWTRWGRIGETGMFQRTPFGTKEEAIVEFLKVFKSKTGNQFEERATFEEKSGKYKLQVTEPQTASARQLEIVKMMRFDPIVLDSWPSDLHESLARFFFVLTDTNALIENMVTGSDLQMPFGSASQSAITQAYDTLSELSEVARLQDKQRSGPTPDYEALKLSDAKISELSNKFYMLIPSKSNVVKQLSTKDEIKQAMTSLNSLSQQNVAANFLMAAYFNRSSMHPFTCMHRSLNISIRPMNHTTDEFSTICNYFNSTSEGNSLSVVEVFHIQRPEDRINFQKFQGTKNRALLWHGTKLSNVLGILKEGLKCAPPNAQVTGHMFGKGVYFADASAKSIGYLGMNSFGNTNSRNHGVLFLAEVALGKTYEASNSSGFVTELPEGYDSIRGIGTKQPSSSLFSVQQGIRIPMGPLINESGGYLAMNEYIVFDSARINIRYMILVETKKFKLVKAEELAKSSPYYFSDFKDTEEDEEEEEKEDEDEDEDEEDDD